MERSGVPGGGPTPYVELNAVLGELLSALRGALGDTLIGLYLQGSFALGDFDEHSDVDFIAVLTTELSETQVQRLQGVHGRIYSMGSEWAKHLDGSYFPASVLRLNSQPRQPVWYLDHGSRSLVRSTHCNTGIVRWVLREHGVTLEGPPPATLVDPINAEALREEIAATIRDWGREILDQPEQYNNRFYQGYLVLAYARMLHDLITGQPSSKRTSAEWAKVTFDWSWSDLIDGAWGSRPNPAAAVRERANQADFRRSLEFVRLVMAQSDILHPRTKSD